MRTAHFRCSPADIQRRATFELRTLLPWQDAGPKLPVDTRLRLLWLMATLRASLHAIVQRFAFPFCDNTARSGLASQLPDPARLASSDASLGPPALKPRPLAKPRDGSFSEQVYAYRGLRPRGHLAEACRRIYKTRFGIE